MTAILALARPDRLEIASDKAVITKSGRLIAWGSKVRRHRTLPICIAASGSGPVPVLAAVGAALRAISETDVDSAFESLPAILETQYKRIANGVDAVFVYCAFSSRNGPRIGITGKAPMFGLDERPFCPVNPQGFVYLGPLPKGGAQELVRRSGVSTSDIEKEGISTAAVPILEQARRIPWPLSTGKLAHIVGWGIEMHTISAAGVSVTNLHRWPDRLFFPICPH